MKKGFTLIELLIVLAIIAILAGILIVVIKPGEIFRKARDTQRTGDLRNLAQAIDSYITENAQSGNIVLDNATNTRCVGGSASTTLFISSAATPTIPGFPSTWTIAATNSQAVNGTGWLPINFQNVAILNISRLPLDPLPTTQYYAYACRTNFNYELNAKLESNTSLMQNDGGDQPNVYEVGPDKTIIYFSPY